MIAVVVIACISAYLIVGGAIYQAYKHLTRESKGAPPACVVGMFWPVFAPILTGMGLSAGIVNIMNGVNDWRAARSVRAKVVKR